MRVAIRVLVSLGVIATLGVAWLARNESARLQLRLAEREDALATAERERGDARAAVERERASAAAAAAAAAERESALESQLQQALAQVAAVNESLAGRVAELQRMQAERHTALEQDFNGPMKPGVRRVLGDLHEQLRVDGHPFLRVIQARGLDDGTLTDVELIERSPDGLGATYYRAGKVGVDLDRDSEVLTFLLQDGVVRREGAAVEPFPEEGLPLAFARVDGPAWEKTFPGLVRAHGQYPPDPEAAPKQLNVDATTRALWVERVEALLKSADSWPKWRIGRCRDVADQRLQAVQLLGYGDSGLLEQTATVERLAVEVDTSTDTVSLLLEDGVLHQRGGDTTIGETGMRLLLPGVSPERAIEQMLGMVVRRSVRR